jgi:hypothetical protein
MSGDEADAKQRTPFHLGSKPLAIYADELISDDSDKDRGITDFWGTRNASSKTLLVGSSGLKPPAAHVQNPR